MSPFLAIRATTSSSSPSASAGLEALSADWQGAGIEAVTPIGDCYAPAEGEVCFRRRASQPAMS
jgi:hypothetical protein